MRLGNVITNFWAGVPLTFIGVLAVVVLAVWLGGDVGSRSRRFGVGFPLLGALIVCWSVLLAQPPERSHEGSLLWVTLAMTALAFVVPLLWRRAARRNG
jgi:drug/metabolite transporter (DMT)-like permease